MILPALAFLAAAAAPAPGFSPNRTIDPYALCSCKNVDTSSTIAFTGIASDAVMTLAPDGRSAEARQATVFRVLKGVSADVPETVKVYHLTNPEKCGVKFDYGKRYAVVAIKKANGELETSWCVMPKPVSP